MSIESIPNFTDSAAKLWATVPTDSKKQLLSNVWCGKCRHEITITRTLTDESLLVRIKVSFEDSQGIWMTRPWPMPFWTASCTAVIASHSREPHCAIQAKTNDRHHHRAKDDLPTASVGTSQAPPAAVDKSAPQSSNHSLRDRRPETPLVLEIHLTPRLRASPARPRWL